MILISSNQNKIKEFKEILWDKLQIEQWKDLREVDWTASEVIFYKTLEAGKSYIVEDTIIKIEWKEMVDIRWKIEHLQEFIWKRVQFIVHIGYNTWEEIIVYQWIIWWTIQEPKWKDGFWFDPFFFPDWEKLSLAELSQQWRKNDFSARRIALENLLINHKEDSAKITNISEWKWAYQKD